VPARWTDCLHAWVRHSGLHCLWHSPLVCRVVHRCGEEILKRELPPKHEVVLKLALTPTQQKVYERYIQVGRAACKPFTVPQVRCGSTRRTRRQPCGAARL